MIAIASLALLCLAAVDRATADLAIYVGAGGCDVSDPVCVPPSTSAENQLQVLRLANGKLSPVGSLLIEAPAIWLVTHPPFGCLFGAVAGTSKVTSYKIKDDGNLIPVSSVAAGGLNPVFLDVLHPNLLLAANYAGPDNGTDDSGAGVASFQIQADCSISLEDHVRHHGHSVNPARQGASHVHSFVADPKGGMAFACDLGQDLIFTYAVDSKGKLSEKSRIAAPPGSGPRHSVVHPSVRILYVVHEMASFVEAFAIGGDGSLKSVQRVSTLASSASGFSKAAEIILSRDAHTLYASNRGFGKGSNSIASFHVGPTGQLTSVPVESPAGGSYPRGVIAVPSSSGVDVLVAGQGTRNIAAFKSGSTRGLELQSNFTGLATPVTMAFWSLGSRIASD